MKPQDKITKIERTDADVDNSIYIIITYDEVIDAEGNTHYVAKKTEKPCVEYDAEVQAKKDALQAEIDKLKDPTEIQKQIEEKETELELLS